MIKKYFVTICLMTVILIVGFSNIAQAKTSYVTDCLEDNLDCEEETNELESDQDEKLTVKEDEGSLLFYIVKMFFALLLILALIYILLKFLTKRNKLFNQVKALENLGGISVGQNKSIQIVRIGTRFYMIGVGENVEMLQEINDEEVINDLLYKEETTEFQAGSLLKALIKPKSNKADTFEDHSNNKFKGLFSNELEKLKENRKKIKNQHNKKEDIHE